MLRRLLLAIALVGDASVLIADEPTPGLHPSAVRDSLGRLRQLADEGKAILLISHDLTASLAVADQVAVFLDGRIVEVAPAEAFSGQGARLCSCYARALWNALPQNEFVATTGPMIDDPRGTHPRAAEVCGSASREIADQEVEHAPGD
jgi:peptide/nickel transport system ATP-binding protein